MDIVEYVGHFGFPAVVTAYVLVRLDTTLRELAKEIHELRAQIGKTT